MAVKYVHDILRIVWNRNQAKQDLQRHHICLTYYDHHCILEEIGRRDKIEYKRNIKGLWGLRITFYSFLVIFISSIELLFVIIPRYVYACDIRYYTIMSLILKPLFLCIIMLFTSQIYLVFLCCLCIWMREKLFQTWQTFLILPKESIWYPMNLVSTEAPFLLDSNIQYPTILTALFKLPALPINCIKVTFLLILWIISILAFFSFLNVIMKILILRITSLVFHYRGIKCNSILKTHRLKSKKYSQIPSIVPSDHPSGSPSVANSVHPIPLPSITPTTLLSDVPSEKPMMLVCNWWIFGWVFKKLFYKRVPICTHKFILRRNHKAPSPRHIQSHQKGPQKTNHFLITQAKTIRIIAASLKYN